MTKVYLFLISLIASTLDFNQVNAQFPAEWQPVSQNNMPANISQSVFPTDYILLKLDVDALKEKLSNAGFTHEEGVIVEMPIGFQKTVSLTIYKNTVLPENLRAEYPEIVTYSAFDKNNHGISAKFDFTPMGFHAMVIDPENGTFMIDPYSKSSDEFYIAYYKHNLDKSYYNQGLCSFDDNDPNLNGLIGNSNTIKINTDAKTMDVQARNNGSLRRTYKIGIACTGEWAKDITGGAPTMAKVLASITSILNRANVVFERELSVSFELIDKQNSLIYLDFLTDPFTCNFDNDCLIEENQDNFNALFPTALNYDLGHIFNTAGGGLAQLRAVCAVNGKARGVSSASSIEDIGVFIHEVGHQLGTSHTFNSGSGGCNGNITEASAYEPGSGSTIMSYNGNCAPDNIPGTSVDYYHVASLKLITDHIKLGDGATCGTTTIGFTPVTVPSLVDSYHIPTNTPFELIAEEATTFEPMPPLVYYCWEQYDLGNPKQPESAASSWTEGPILMSLPPTFYRNRSFPGNELVKDNKYSAPGKRLPNVTRNLKFKLTNRSVFEGWGTFNYSEGETKVITNSGSPFRVTQPSIGKLLAVGEPVEIKWDTVKTRQPPINTGFVNIYMSIDGGLTFPFIIVTNAPNIGSYTIAAPDVYSNNVRFKVKGSGNIFFDMNKVDMQIHGKPVGIDNPDDLKVQNIKIYPNPTSDNIYLSNSQLLHKPFLVKVVNMVGQQVYQDEFVFDHTINVSNFAKGIYIVQIIDQENGNTRTEKISVK